MVRVCNYMADGCQSSSHAIATLPGTAQRQARQHTSCCAPKRTVLTLSMVARPGPALASPFASMSPRRRWARLIQRAPTPVSSGSTPQQARCAGQRWNRRTRRKEWLHLLHCNTHTRTMCRAWSWALCVPLLAGPRWRPSSVGLGGAQGVHGSQPTAQSLAHTSAETIGVEAVLLSPVPQPSRRTTSKPSSRQVHGVAAACARVEWHHTGNRQPQGLAGSLLRNGRGLNR